MNLRKWFTTLSTRLNLQFIKLSWLDLSRDKARAIFGVLGISVSLFLLTAVGITTDTLNYRTVKGLNDVTGSADIIITRTFSTDINFDYAFEQALIEDSLQDIEGVEEFFPRIMMPVKFSSEKTSDNGTLQLYGIDFEAEHNNGRMGELYIVDEKGERTEKIYKGVPKEGECVLLWNAAALLNVSRGDVITIDYNQWEDTYTVVEICEQERKFMEFETAAVILDLPVCQAFFHRPGQINHIVGKIVYGEDFYDSRNIQGVNFELRQIAERIQDRLDINRYQVILPKLEVLEGSQIGFELLSILFWIIALFSMMISGIMINGILSTSVEERIREFGILRVVGGKKSFLIKMVLFEGFLYGIIGTLLGLMTALFIGLPLIVGFIEFTDPEAIPVIYMIYPETILTTFIIGITVPLLVAMNPALKVFRQQLVKSLNPLQSKEKGWEIEKEGSVSVKRVIFGLATASVGILLFMMLPQIIALGNFTFLAMVFIGLLEAILIGMVLASLGIIPLVQKIIVTGLKPFFKRYIHLIESSLKRYRRRNTSTIILFAISFSFVFFLTSLIEIEKQNVSYTLNYLYGSDIVIVNQGYEEEGEAITLGMVEDLQEFTAIDQVSYSLHNTFDIQAAMAILMEAQSGEPKFIEDMAQNQITEMLQFYLTQIETKFQLHAADISEHDSTYASFIGINEEFPKMVDKDSIIWSSPNSGFEHSFDQIFAHNDSCIIAKSIANTLGIYEVGEKIRLTFYDPLKENDTGHIHVFKVAGISGGIPGFWNFRSADYFSFMGGVMVSCENYMRLMNVSHRGTEDMVIDKIFINLLDDSLENIEETMELIQEKFGDKRFAIDDAKSKIKLVDEITEDTNSLIELIFMFAVLTSVFGLISSMYSIILERKFEIGILRSMGMRSKDVRNMFILESLILMLSAGLMGTFIGAFSAYLLLSNLAIVPEIPIVFAIPSTTFTRIFFLSTVVTIVGMYVMMNKFGKYSIMDIFREAV